MLELEGGQLPTRYILTLKEMANNAGLGDVWDRINNGYVEMTPSGGIHWLYRIEALCLATRNLQEGQEKMATLMS
jgi:putative DNA primase/helicase